MVLDVILVINLLVPLPTQMILLSLSLTGLQKLLDVCKIYSNEFSLMFNENKLVCIKFSKVVTDNNIADVYLGENKLKWDNKVKHLGNFVSSTQSDKDDIDSKINSFIVSVNTLMAKFGFLQTNILDFLLI